MRKFVLVISNNLVNIVTGFFLNKAGDLSSLFLVFLLSSVFVIIDLVLFQNESKKKLIFIIFIKKDDEKIASEIRKQIALTKIPKGKQIEINLISDTNNNTIEKVNDRINEFDLLIILFSSCIEQDNNFNEIKEYIKKANNRSNNSKSPFIKYFLDPIDIITVDIGDSYSSLRESEQQLFNPYRHVKFTDDANLPSDTAKLAKDVEDMISEQENKRKEINLSRIFLFFLLLSSFGFLSLWYISPYLSPLWNYVIINSNGTPTPTPTSTFSPTPTPTFSPTPTPTLSPTPTPSSIPILGDKKVRQAIAHCIDRDELIETVYPFLSKEERRELLMYSFLPQKHPFVAQDKNTDAYAFDPRTRSNNLLSQAGWELPTRTPKPHEQEQLIITDTVYRKNSEGKRLDLEILTTDEPKFRDKYVKKIEDQLEKCGIRVTRPANNKSISVFKYFLPQRDFDLAVFAWDAAIEPRGSNRYTCNQVRSQDNKFKGENYMGWCNKDADEKLIIANNTLDRDKRIEKYRDFQHDFVEEMVSLPLFAHQEVIATSKRVKNLKIDRSVDSYVANIDEWELNDGDQNYTVTLGLTREPSQLFLENESDVSDFIAASLLKARAATSYSETYQAVALKSLPTIENGGATNEIVKVKPDKIVWTTKGMTESLHSGVQVIDASGEPITYTGSETLEMRQLKVTFVFTNGLKWEDGQPLVAADLELAKRIGCESRALNSPFCASIANVQYSKNSEPLTYTITYYPGAQWPEYSVQTLGFYSSLYTVGAFPSHQEVDFKGEKRKLTEIPTEDLLNLTEIVTQPLSYGPYKLLSWDKGKQMVFAANPYYYKGEPKIKRVVIKFFDIENTAVNELLNGTIDVLSVDGMDRMKEIVEEGKKDAKERKINTYTITGAMWEHLDMNLAR